jgi:hypothetical protein
MKYTFHEQLIIEHTHYLGQGHSRSFLRGQGHSVHVPYLSKKILFQQFKQAFDHITYYRVTIMYIFFRQWLLKVNLERSM